MTFPLLEPSQYCPALKLNVLSFAVVIVLDLLTVLDLNQLNICQIKVDVWAYEFCN